MGQNVGNGPVVKLTSDYHLERRMVVFDSFPATLRRALANSDNDWSVEQCHVSLKGGCARRKIKGHTAAELVKLIEDNDTRRRKAA